MGSSKYCNIIPSRIGSSCRHRHDLRYPILWSCLLAMMEDLNRS